jgi:hypothetical protein
MSESPTIERLNDLLTFTQRNCLYCYYILGPSGHHKHTLQNCSHLKSFSTGSSLCSMCRDCLSICGNNGHLGCRKKFVYEARGICFRCGCNQKVGNVPVGNHSDPKKCTSSFAHQSFVWYVWRNHKQVLNSLFDDHCLSMDDDDFRKWIGKWNERGRRDLNRFSTLLLYCFDNPLA